MSVICSFEQKGILLSSNQAKYFTFFVVTTIGTAVLSYRQIAEKLVRLQQKKKSKKQRHQKMASNLKET